MVKNLGIVVFTAGMMMMKRASSFLQKNIDAVCAEQAVGL